MLLRQAGYGKTEEREKREGRHEGMLEQIRERIKRLLYRANFARFPRQQQWDGELRKLLHLCLTSC